MTAGETSMTAGADPGALCRVRREVIREPRVPRPAVR